MNPRDENEATPKSYVYVPGQARLNIGNIHEDPPVTMYEKYRALLRRKDVKNQVTKRSTEPDANTDS